MAWWQAFSGTKDPSPNKPGDSRQADPEFIKLFGDYPKWEDFRHLGKSALMSFQVAKVAWQEALEHFKGTAGIPPGFTFEQVREANRLFVKWGITEPVFYDGRFGWMGRFVHSQIPDYDSPAFQILSYPHHVISTFQVENFRRNGIKPPKWHPFVPLAVISMLEQKKEAELVAALEGE